MANRRPVEWRGVAWNDYAQSPLGTVTRHTIVNAAGLSVYTKPTIVRLRGLLGFKLNAANNMTASNVTGVQAGIGIFHEDATAVSPLDSEEDWMWRWSGLLIRAFQTTETGTVRHIEDVSGYLEAPVDVRAMRKVQSTHHMLALFIWCDDLDGTPSDLQHFGHIRCLVKE